MSISCATFLAITAYLLIFSVINKDVRDDLWIINENAKVKRNRLLTLNYLAEFIEIHSTLRELSALNVLYRNQQRNNFAFSF